MSAPPYGRVTGLYRNAAQAARRARMLTRDAEAYRTETIYGVGRFEPGTWTPATTDHRLAMLRTEADVYARDAEARLADPVRAIEVYRELTTRLTPNNHLPMEPLAGLDRVVARIGLDAAEIDEADNVAVSAALLQWHHIVNTVIDGAEQTLLNTSRVLARIQAGDMQPPLDPVVTAQLRNYAQHVAMARRSQLPPGVPSTPYYIWARAEDLADIETEINEAVSAALHMPLTRRQLQGELGRLPGGHIVFNPAARHLDDSHVRDQWAIEMFIADLLRPGRVAAMDLTSPLMGSVYRMWVAQGPEFVLRGVAVQFIACMTGRQVSTETSAVLVAATLRAVMGAPALSRPHTAMTLMDALVERNLVSG